MLRFLTNTLARLVSGVVRLAKLSAFVLVLYLLYRVTRAMAPFVVPVWVDGVESMFDVHLPGGVSVVSNDGFGKELGLFLLGVAAYVCSTWVTYRVDTWLSRRRLDGFLIHSSRKDAKKERDSKDELILAYARPAERTGRLTSFIMQVVGSFCGLLVWHYYVQGSEAIEFFKSLVGQLNPLVASTQLFLVNQEMFIRLAIGLCGLAIALWCLCRIGKREARAHALHYYMTDRALVVVQSYLGGWFKAGNRLVLWKIKPWHPRKILYGHLRMPEPQTTFTEEFFWNRRTMTIPFETDVHLEGPEAVLYHVKPEFFWLTDSGKREEYIQAHPELRMA